MMYDFFTHLQHLLLGTLAGVATLILSLFWGLPMESTYQAVVFILSAGVALVVTVASAFVWLRKEIQANTFSKTDGEVLRVQVQDISQMLRSMQEDMRDMRTAALKPSGRQRP